MSENAESRSARGEHQSRHTPEVVAWATIGLLLAVWILAYAFAVNGLIISGDRFHEADISTGWHQLGAPTDVDVAKQR